MRRLCAVTIALALALGCAEKPPADEAADAKAAQEGAAVYDAGATPAAEPAAPKPARIERRKSEPGLEMPDTIVTISARPIGEVFDAALAMADAVKPGVSVIARMGLFGGLELPPDTFMKVATGKPMRVYVFNPKGQSGAVAMVFGDGGEGGMAFLTDTISQKAGVAPQKVGNTVTFDFGGDRMIITRSAPWIVLGDNAATVASVAGGLKDEQPTFPDGEDHIAVDVDVAAIRGAFEGEIAHGMMQLRNGVGAVAAQQGEVMGRVMQEYFNFLEGALNAADRVEVSLRFQQTSLDCMMSIVPTAGKDLEALATKQGACGWKSARALPPNAAIAAAWSIDPAVVEPMMDILGGAVARVAVGATPEPEQIEKYKAMLRPFVAVREGASAITIGDALNATYATSADAATMRKIYQDTMPELNAAVATLLRGMGVEMEYVYKENVRQLDGKPVDALSMTTRATNEMGRNQLAMTMAMWGSDTQVMELAEAATGTVSAIGPGRAEALTAAKAAAAGGAHPGFGWAGASKGLQEALSMSPENTWAAYEMKLGAYTAFALKALKTAQPMIGAMIPDASELDAGEGDPPMVGWIASDDGRLVCFNRVPTATMATFEKYIEKVVAIFRGGGMAPGGAAPIAPPPGDDMDLF